MKSYFGRYKPGPGAEEREATILVFEKNISIGFRDEQGANQTVSWLVKDISWKYEFGKQETIIRCNRVAGELAIEGKDAAAYLEEQAAERKRPWYKRDNGRYLVRHTLFFMGFVAVLVTAYLLLVPWLSEKLAAKVAPSTEQSLGDAVYDAMGLSAQEDKRSTLLLNDFFSAMDISTPYSIRISVVNSEVVNAFALPGGRIVVYTALLRQVNSYPELAALLSHEFTHVNNKHSTKSIFRRLGSKVFLGLLFGRFGSVTSVLVNHADDLKSLKYSRRLEKEADMGGLELLLARGIDPNGFVDLFTHLNAAAPASALPEFLASHPDIDNRITYIREAAAGKAIKENPTLESIFIQRKK